MAKLAPVMGKKKKSPHSLEHRHPPKRLRRILQRMLQVLDDRLLPYGLFDPFLTLDLVRVRCETLELRVGLLVSLARLTEELGEAGRV